jgi:hypothetical protein
MDELRIAGDEDKDAYGTNERPTFWIAMGLK